ncbi:Bifunctional nuclease [Trifolium repens]|nr:Bifunctional nuclease [Trifolium repens]
MMKCVGVINVTGGWDWSTSPHNCLLEMLSVLLMAAVRNVQIVCLLFSFSIKFHHISSKILDPIGSAFMLDLLYQVVKDMIDKMVYEVRAARVTKRVHEAYFAEIYLSKVNFELRNNARPNDKPCVETKEFNVGFSVIKVSRSWTL